MTAESPTSQDNSARVEQPASERIDPVSPAEVDPLFIAAASSVRFDADPEPIGPTLDAAAAGAAAGGGDDDCGLSQALQGALDTDPSLRSAVSRIPASARSVANVVNVWNGRWVELGGAGEPIRAAIGRLVDTAPSECLARPVSGPRLFMVAGETRTTTLALGSGEWRWAQLAVTAAP